MESWQVEESVGLCETEQRKANVASVDVEIAGYVLETVHVVATSVSQRFSLLRHFPFPKKGRACHRPGGNTWPEMIDHPWSKVHSLKVFTRIPVIFELLFCLVAAGLPCAAFNYVHSLQIHQRSMAKNIDCTSAKVMHPSPIARAKD
jgi:hypothetical protein